ncbi:hypothetical protein [Pacificoceanicola onchidii]|uniref:hypothetical protein n=1 Tax=Pacificoceanicola onchidii TaxID=2562685 RepID=UPI0010A48195|nr:hypothetical protein [Pacificoceanicola onchidii]
MDFFSLLLSLQTGYLERFEAGLAELQTKHAGVQAEVGFELSQKAEVYKKLYVVDALTEDGSVVEFAPSEMNYSPRGNYGYKSLEISAAPLTWDAICLSPVTSDLPGFEKWFTHWLDIEAKRYDVEAGHGAAIHSVVFNGEAACIDFGTAPIAAMTDLLDLLIAGDISHLILTDARTD